MMADQKRWFKVWTSIAANARFAEMSLEDVGRWTLLGAATALDGDHGRLEVPGRGKELCRLLRVDDIDAARHALKRLHSVQFEEGENRHGELSVTWKNWKKYQEDSTQAARQKTSRSKKRREEKRREVPPTVPHEGVLVGDSLNQAEAPQAARVQGPSVSSPGPVPQATTARKARRPEEFDPVFEGFYAVYPRNEAKQPAWRAWKTLRVSSGLAEEIMAALTRHRDRWQRLGTASDKIPLPASWLNGKRWMDQFDVPQDPYTKFPRGDAGA